MFSGILISCLCWISTVIVFLLSFLTDRYCRILILFGGEGVKTFDQVIFVP